MSLPTLPAAKFYRIRQECCTIIIPFCPRNTILGDSRRKSVTSPVKLLKWTSTKRITEAERTDTYCGKGVRLVTAAVAAGSAVILRSQLPAAVDIA